MNFYLGWYIVHGIINQLKVNYMNPNFFTTLIPLTVTYLHLSCYLEAFRWVLVWHIDLCLSDEDICPVEDYQSSVLGNIVH